MLPVNYVYPKFVPDQLLTSDDLNELFSYLDKQGRLTRTNLIGIGIVCGLEVQVNATKTNLTITKGTGVTSAGYLINVPTTVYTKASTFDAVKEIYYDKFVDVVAGTQKLDLWELKEADDETGDIIITESFLADKAVLLFVELLEVKNKNCDPNSCDDKGVHVNVTFRPLLVRKVEAGTLIGATGSQKIDFVIDLPDIRMRRFDVPNTNPVTSTQIFDAYKTILNTTFLAKTEEALTKAWTLFKPFAQDEYKINDPFVGLAEDFDYVNDGSISTNQLQHIQYIYDHFSDLLQAYDEFRKTGKHVLSVCCPDCSLFPRHLLLGEAIPLAAGTVSAFRHYFIYSPLFDQRNVIEQLKVLFKKLVLIREKFVVPVVSSGSTSSKLDPYIRITPSTLGDVELSKKAIPYYYQVATGPYPLYKSWSLQKALQGVPQRNLSYHANQYNGTDEFVLKPLLYDLEPYNFLRVEGVIGKPYTKVLQNLKALISENRLPVDVIALNTENTNLLQGISSSNASSFSLSGMIDDLDLEELLCHFQDLEALYDAMKNEILCNLCKELKYYYDLKFGTPPTGAQQAATKVELLTTCSKGYIVRPDTFGFYIEKLYSIVGDEGNITYQMIAELLDLERLVGGDRNNDGNPDRLTASMAAYLGILTAYFEIPIYIIRLAKTFTDDLSAFDVDEYCRIHKLLAEKATAVKFAYDIYSYEENTKSTSTSGASFLQSLFTKGTNQVTTIFSLEDLFDHLDTLIYNCKCSAFKALKAEYLERVVKLTMLRQFGYFIKQHPGIQHKAGVPMGGTFIIVYHNKPNIITKGKAFGRFVIKGKVVDEEGHGVRNGSVSMIGSDRTGKIDASGNFGINLTELPATLVFHVIGFDRKEVIVTSDNPIVVKMGVDEDAEPESAIDDIATGIVIADFYLPYRCCSDCPPIQYVVPEIKELPPANEGPVADAGTDQMITLPVNTVSLNGSGSTDADGSIALWQWVKLNGPATFNISTPNSATTTVTNLVQGNYEFELTVTDNKGSTARDSMRVVVNPAPRVNQPPIANAGANSTYTISISDPLTLDGSASTDPDGTIQSYSWQQESGPNNSVIIPTSNLEAQVTGLTAGEYKFKLTVTDNDGASHSATVTIDVVLPENKLPDANAGIDQVITLPVNSVTLNGSASADSDGTIVAHSWNLTGTPPNTPVFGNSSAAVTTVSNLVQGTYEFELKVTDDRGGSATDTVKVTVNPAKEKSCAPLKDVMALFEMLQETDPERFGLFTNMFRSYQQVEAYFKQLDSDKVPDMPVNEQIDFFASPMGNATINELLMQWLKELQELIINNPENLRALALTLYQILVQLSMYIVCIQKEDADKAKVRMDDVFRLIEEHTTEWVAAHKQKPWSAKELDIVKEIRADLSAEDVRINNNGEAATKPQYLAAIRAIIRILDAIV